MATLAPDKWPDSFLDEMRGVGDPPADQVITTLFASGKTYSVQELFNTLVQNDQAAPQDLPAEVRNYFEIPIHVPPDDLKWVEAGQSFFERCGPEILMVLACYSLPASYAARKGVQVLYRTGFLQHRPNHRLFETTQMLMDVLVAGGLNGNGRGIRTTQKVRLMHAAIRQLLLTDPERSWDKEFGVPINQEDLAGTFLVFTYVIIDGLHRLGIETSADEEQGYLETWKVIGRIMGIQESLIPDTMAAAMELCERIQKRQLQPCPEGKAMNDALLQLLESKLPPGPWRNWPAVLMRHFLPPDIADGFGLPQDTLAEHLLQIDAESTEEIGSITDESKRRPFIFRKISLLLMKGLVTMELDGKRTPFVIPTNLRDGWALSR